MRRFLPYAVLAAVLVLVVPAVTVWMLFPADGGWRILLAIALTTAMSIAIARVLAVVWAHHTQSHEIVFADLLPWGLVRRMLLERKIRDARRVLGKCRDSRDPGTRDELARTLADLAAALGARDAATLGHSRRVARHAENIAKRMQLNKTLVAQIRVGAAVHDVGKINTPREILNKPSPLTDEEFAVIKRHASDGAAMVSELNDDVVTAMVRSHHERLDGSGYPAGLAGDDIPVGARIIAVADTFDAMTSRRSYRKKFKHEDALAALREEAGVRLDPTAVEAFGSYYSARRSVPGFAFLAAVPERAVAWLLGPAVSGLSTGWSAAASAIAIGAAAVAVGATPAPPAPPAQAQPASVTHAAAGPQAATGSDAADPSPEPPTTADPQPTPAAAPQPTTPAVPAVTLPQVTLPAVKVPPSVVPKANINAVDAATASVSCAVPQVGAVVGVCAK